jgi:uncharacterized protein with von Willebrand factor type A (vWA) domain
MEWSAAASADPNLQPHRQPITVGMIRDILERARLLVRHAARPVRAVEYSWPSPGDLDVERTLEHSGPHVAAFGPGDLRVSRPEPREADVVVVLDMSLSMTGEKVALVALATAILRMRLEHVAVVAFDSRAHRLVRVGEAVPLRELVRRVLEVPARGYTNIEAGLAAGLEELGRARRRERVALLFTDGCANIGADPLPTAARFPRLHVVHLGDYNPVGARNCKAMALAGRGKLFRAHSYPGLPKVVRAAVCELFRS